jgi:hypothetical protein
VGSSIERSLLEPSSNVLSLCRGRRGEGAKCKEVRAPRSGSASLPWIEAWNVVEHQTVFYVSIRITRTRRLRTGSERDADRAREVADVEEEGVSDRTVVRDGKGKLDDVQRCYEVCQHVVVFRSS